MTLLKFSAVETKMERNKGVGSGMFHLAHGSMARADEVDGIPAGKIKQYFLNGDGMPLWIVADKDIKSPLCLLIGSLPGLAAAATLSCGPITISSPTNSSSRKIFVSLTPKRLPHWEKVEKMSPTECEQQQLAALVKAHFILHKGERVIVQGQEININHERQSANAIKAVYLATQATGSALDLNTIAAGIVGRNTLTANDQFVSKPISAPRPTLQPSILGKGVALDWDAIANINSKSSLAEAMDSEPTTAEKRAAALAKDAANFNALFDLFADDDTDTTAGGDVDGPELTINLASGGTRPTTIIHETSREGTRDSNMGRRRLEGEVRLISNQHTLPPLHPLLASCNLNQNSPPPH